MEEETALIDSVCVKQLVFGNREDVRGKLGLLGVEALRVLEVLAACVDA